MSCQPWWDGGYSHVRYVGSLPLARLHAVDDGGREGGGSRSHRHRQPRPGPSSASCGGDGDGGTAAAAQPQEIETPPLAASASSGASINTSTSRSNPAQVPSMGTGGASTTCSTSAGGVGFSRTYNGDYLSDYETLLTNEENVSRTVAEVVEDMRRTGGRPRRPPHATAATSTAAADADASASPGAGRSTSPGIESKRQQGDRNAARKVPVNPTSNMTTISPPEAGRMFSNASSSSLSPPSSSGGSGSDRSRRRRRNNSSNTNTGTSSHGTVLDRHAESILQVDSHFRYASGASCLVYVLLVFLSFRSCPAEQIQPLGGLERNAAALAAILLFVSVVSTLLPLLYRGRKGSVSGVIVAALVVQTVAFTSDVLMATIAVPVMIDPVAGTRVHLLRWCEWTPLAFLMTFLTEGVGVPDGDAGDGSDSRERSRDDDDDDVL